MYGGVGLPIKYMYGGRVTYKIYVLGVGLPIK